jgi:ParB family chromosome partitioning protein
MATDFLVRNVYGSESDEWYSPHPFVEAARKVLGPIDLDPASCETANSVVQASRIYTKEDDGLSQPWTARTLWCNPPYGRLGSDRQKGITELWVDKLIREYECGNVEQAILLVNAYVYKVWFAPLWRYPICFPTGRLAFWNDRGKTGRSPHPSALVYFGQNVQRFVDVFDPFGSVVQRIPPTPAVPVPTLWDEIA